MANEHLFFQTGDGVASARTIWSSTGTTTSTVQVLILPDTSTLNDMQSVGSQLFFVVGTADGQQELWVSDGSATGTHRVRTFADATNAYLLVFQGTFQDQALLKVYQADTGWEPWLSDGTAAGTRLLKDINPGGNSNPQFYVTLHDRLFFFADDGSPGIALWSSDGTTDGTTRVAHLDADAAPRVYGLTAFQDRLLFSLLRANAPSELWISDGTAAGTTQVGAPNTSDSSYPIRLTPALGQLAFVADDGLHGWELWLSDGTAPGTCMVADLRSTSSPAEFALAPHELTAYHNLLLFAAQGNGDRIQLWRSDGSATGTFSLTISVPSQLTIVSDTVYFRGRDLSQSVQLWKSDGTVSGTMQVNSLDGLEVVDDYTPVQLAPDGLHAVGNRLLFSASNGYNGRELWVSDGSAAGTQMVKDINPGRADALYASNEGYGPIERSPLCTVGARLFFAADDGTHGSEVWVSDGTAAGTQLVRDITPGSAGTILGSLTAVQDRLWFTTLISNEVALWTSDGTAAGTQRVWTFSGVWWPYDTRLRLVLPALVVLGPRVFLTLNRTDAGVELWTSDGTADGTHAVDLGPSGVRAPGDLTVIDDRLLFSGYTPDRGIELWMTDGTADGTVPLSDIAPGAASAMPGEMTAVGDSLVLRAATHVVGSELWRLPRSILQPEAGRPTPTTTTQPGPTPTTTPQRHIYLATLLSR